MSKEGAIISLRGIVTHMIRVIVFVHNSSHPFASRASVLTA